MSNSDDESADDRGESVLTLEDPSDDTTDTADEPEPESSPRHLKRRILAALLALVAVAATAALVTLSIGEYQHRRDDALRTQAVEMSRDYLVSMAAFDYQKMDANREHIVANSTPGSRPSTTRWSRRSATSW